jgi:hypothetical protein
MYCRLTALWCFSFLILVCFGQESITLSEIQDRAVEEFQRSDWTAAERDFREVAKRDPTNIFANMYLAQTLFRPAPLAAQTFTIRLLNGKTGKAMPNRKVTVRWADGLKSSEVSIGENGLGFLEVVPGSLQFVLTVGPRPGNETYRLAYINCNEPAMAMIQVTQASETGVVPGNKCGSHTAVSKPGEIVFWAMPKPSWLPDFQ